MKVYVTISTFGPEAIVYLGTSLDDAKAAADVYDKAHFDFKYEPPMDWDSEAVPRTEQQPPNLVESLYALGYRVSCFEVSES